MRFRFVCFVGAITQGQIQGELQVQIQARYHHAGRDKCPQTSDNFLSGHCSTLVQLRCHDTGSWPSSVKLHTCYLPAPYPHPPSFSRQAMKALIQRLPIQQEGLADRLWQIVLTQSVHTLCIPCLHPVLYPVHIQFIPSSYSAISSPLCDLRSVCGTPCSVVRVFL